MLPIGAKSILKEQIPFRSGCFVQGSEQEVMKVLSLHKKVLKNIHLKSDEKANENVMRSSLTEKTEISRCRSVIIISVPIMT